MRDEIRRLSPRSEFFFVVAVSFGFFIIVSIYTLLRRVQRFDMTTGRAVRGIAIEMVILGVVVAFLHMRRYDFAALGLRFSFGAFFAGVPVFVLAILAYWFTYFVAIVVYAPVRDLQPPRMAATAPFALLIVLIVVNSLFEESLVNAYIINALSHEGASVAITTSTLIRFLYHLYQGPVSSLSILPIGLIFGAVYWRWRNLWPVMVAHTIMNLLSFAVNR